MAVFSFLAAAAGLAYAYSKLGHLPRVEIAETLTTSDEAGPRSPENYLIVGVDSAEGLDPDDPVRSTRGAVGGLRSDTMMILRVDPSSSRAALLSIPRDLYVPIAGTRGQDRINAAIQLGGPEGLVETVQDYFGVPINHYVQIDFFGFHRLVEALDGVPVYFPHPVRDPRTGLFVPEAGCVTLDPANALGFVRSRHYQEKIDGRWRTDPTGDIGRVRRQQDFIQRALRRAVEKGIRNPVTVDELIDAGLEAVAVDDTLSGDDFLDLAGQFRTFRADALDLYSLPVTNGSVGGASILRLIDRQAEPVLDVFRGNDPSSIDEASVRVSVLNGTGRPAEATSARDDLREVGFATGSTGDAGSTDHRRTEVRYAPGNQASAELVDRWLVNRARLVEDPDVSDVTLVTGADYEGLRTAARPAPPTSSTTLPTTTTTTTTTRPAAPGRSTTTTTVLGTIPVETPEAIACG